jgi:hypothetical protein
MITSTTTKNRITAKATITPTLERRVKELKPRDVLSGHVLDDQHRRLVSLVDTHTDHPLWACLGLNQGPPACEAGALPLSYTPSVA